MTTPGEPTGTSTEPVSDEQLVRSFTFLTAAFGGALLLVTLLGVLWIVPDPTTSPTGLLVGAVLAAVAWFAPRLVIRASLRRPGPGVVGATEAQARVRAAVMTGLAVAEAPALLGLVLAVSFGDGHDVGALVVSAPVAIVSLVVNVSGPGAVRRHLAQVRSDVVV